MGNLRYGKTGEVNPNNAVYLQVPVVNGMRRLYYRLNDSGAYM